MLGGLCLFIDMFFVEGFFVGDLVLVYIQGEFDVMEGKDMEQVVYMVGSLFSDLVCLMSIVLMLSFGLICFEDIYFLLFLEWCVLVIFVVSDVCVYYQVVLMNQEVDCMQLKWMQGYFFELVIGFMFEEVWMKVC